MAAKPRRAAVLRGFVFSGGDFVLEIDSPIDNHAANHRFAFEYNSDRQLNLFSTKEVERCAQAARQRRLFHVQPAFEPIALV
jgi:hypothetical protein